MTHNGAPRSRTEAATSSSGAGAALAGKRSKARAGGSRTYQKRGKRPTITIEQGVELLQHVLGLLLRSGLECLTEDSGSDTLIRLPGYRVCAGQHGKHFVAAELLLPDSDLCQQCARQQPV